GDLKLSIVARLGLGRWDVADRLEEAPIVVPVHPLEGGELDRFQTAPRAAPADHLGLEQAIYRLGERVVIAIPDTADGGFDASLEAAIGAVPVVCRARGLKALLSTRCCGRRAVGCGRRPGGWDGMPRRSRANCDATPRRAVAAWSIGRRRRSGMPSGRRVGRSQ